MQDRPDGAAILALSKARKRRSLIWRIFLAVVATSALVAVLVFKVGRASGQNYHYLTKPARVGDLRETVTATGTLKGLDSVDVGAQISGRIVRVLVDVNDQVTAGQVLAEIDPEQLRSRVEQSKAQVRAADAAVSLAKATAAQSRLQYERQKDLSQKGLASQKDLESAQADAERARASVASAEAQASLSRASLKDVQTSLGYTTIRAPMDGVVLARLVEPGQTVAAQLQSPVLFTIARGLAKLELRVDVDEADVGRVKKDLPATFTVDAWPNRKFQSRVVSVYNLPTAGQTVVTYKAVLTVDNQDLSLRPGMTATASIITNERKGVLLVPNAALRFSPPAKVEKSSGPPTLPMMPMRPPRMGAGAGSARPRANAANQGTVWILNAVDPKATPEPSPVSIEVGGSDGENSEMVRGPLKEGQGIIVDVEQRKGS
ncbi:MAG TPA: efflux RND transporter periplasmic adaptor subunit [Polyangiaceae bacterium]|nr:efflux RND transporter periplasmic adaptor subunit [Polyangiaceae bacterium]